VRALQRLQRRTPRRSKAFCRVQISSGLRTQRGALFASGVPCARSLKEGGGASHRVEADVATRHATCFTDGSPAVRAARWRRAWIKAE
jgi:hypothetical protein